MRIEIINNLEELKRERFIFWINDFYIILNDYFLEGKESKRKRKWENIKRYSRIGDLRMESYKTEILKEIPIISENIKDLVMKEINSKLRFKL